MDIAQSVVTALKWNTIVPPDRVTVAVARGWVTLKGTLEWQYQKNAAAARHDRRARSDRVGHLEVAVKRSAEIDARGVSVAAQDGKVILTGNVRSWAERQEAERAASAAPGSPRWKTASRSRLEGGLMASVPMTRKDSIGDQLEQLHQQQLPWSRRATQDPNLGRWLGGERV